MTERKQHCSDCANHREGRIRCLSQKRFDLAKLKGTLNEEGGVGPLYGSNTCEHYEPSSTTRLANAVEDLLTWAKGRKNADLPEVEDKKPEEAPEDPSDLWGI